MKKYNHCLVVICIVCKLGSILQYCTLDHENTENLAWYKMKMSLQQNYMSCISLTHAMQAPNRESTCIAFLEILL